MDKNVVELNKEELEEVNAGYEKEPGADKNAKVIFSCNDPKEAQRSENCSNFLD